MQTVGYIGLGIMGKSIARNILKAGFPVVVYNRSRASVNELVAEGAVEADDFYQIIADWATDRAGISAASWALIDELEAGILGGSIVVPTADTLEQMSAVRAEYLLNAP